MKKIFLALVVLGFMMSICSADEYVNGYYKKNGTYVQPYHRTSPNNSTYDNYSTRGNTNPYNGNRGTVDPNSQYNNGLNGRHRNSNPYNNGLGE
jgi:hypothetical protein